MSPKFSQVITHTVHLHLRWKRDFLYGMCDHLSALPALLFTHIATLTSLHMVVLMRDSNVLLTCVPHLMTPQHPFHLTFMLLLRNGQSDYSSFLFLTVSPDLRHFFFCFSIPCASSIPSTCSIFQSHASFFQHSLCPLKMCTCAINFLFSICSWCFFCP